MAGVTANRFQRKGWCCGTACTLVLVACCSVLRAVESIPHAIRDAIFGQPDGDVSALDINEDGKVDIADLISAAAALPRASFTTPTIEVREGGPSFVCTVATDVDFTGIVQYQISGTAVAGSDYEPLTGNLLVESGTGVISVSLLDGVEVEDTEVLLLSIIAPTPSPPAYGLGPQNTMVVVVVDDDELWQGELRRGSLRIPLELTIAHDAGEAQASLDGDGSGAFPAGSWPVAVDEQVDRFDASIGPIELQSTPLIASSASLVVQLHCDPTTDPEHSYDLESAISGSAQWAFTFLDPSAQHLDRVGSGAVVGHFKLLKSARAVPTIETSLIPSD